MPKSPTRLKQGLPINTLLKNSLRDPDIKNSKYVTVVGLSKKVRNSRITCSSSTRTRMPNEPVRSYKQLVQVVDSNYTGAIYASKGLRVSCNCDRHKFMWEYALTRQGASWIQFSNGDPPAATNPSFIAGVCKHLFKVLLEIKGRQL